jgi:DNA primase
MAARIPERLKREIIERNDMLAIVGDVVELRRSGTSIKGLCPFHDEKTPSFTVNAASKVFYCHGCQAGGDMISFVQETRGLSFVEAIEFLASRVGIELLREELSPQQLAKERKERSQRGRLLALNAAAQSFFVAQLRGKAGQVGRDYIEMRGLSDETRDKFGLGVAPDAWDALTSHLQRNGFSDEDIERVGLGMRRRNGQGLIDRFRDRLMFPVYQRNDDVVAFGGRQLGDDAKAAKYMNSPEAELSELEVRYNNALWKFYKKSNCVFGLPQARRGIRRESMALLVEGNLDVMMLHQVGEDHAVCAMGTALTDGQLKQIRRFTDRIALVFDGDSAGRSATKKAVPLCMAAGFDGSYVVLPEGEDPDSYVRKYGVEAWRKIVAEADNLITGYIDAHVATWDGTLLGKAKILQEVRPQLAAIPDPIARDEASDYLGTRILGSHIEDNRLKMSRYLRYADTGRPTPQVGRVSNMEGPAAEIAVMELDLVRIVFKDPSLLVDIERVDGLRFLRHRSLAEALAGLGRLTEAHDEVTVADLRDAVQAMPEGVVRHTLLRVMVETKRIKSPNNVAILEEVLDRLEVAGLKRTLDELIAETKREKDEQTLRKMAAKSLEIRRRIEALNQRERHPSATPPGA